MGELAYQIFRGRLWLLQFEGFRTLGEVAGPGREIYGNPSTNHSRMTWALCNNSACPASICFRKAEGIGFRLRIQLFRVRSSYPPVACPVPYSKSQNLMYVHMTCKAVHFRLATKSWTSKYGNNRNYSRRVMVEHIEPIAYPRLHQTIPNPTSCMLDPKPPKPNPKPLTQNP